ncbi:MAG: hypothetical protein Unbinned92contig1003_1 [Prokaryotic dsDNA virus sp.]|nr:MAG: hypothetical protein Unbinned92contig1003_1 [Prokaryotic dsDNA virus sp.]|tara:strand:+ start:18332 stop:19027 length:696 start_codon:yes stop_codon:yes gene_type:complete
MFLANALKLKSRVATAFDIGSVSNIKAWYKLKTGQTVSSGNLTVWADSSGNTTEDMDLDVVSGVLPINTTTGAVNFNTVDKGFISTSSDQLNLSTFTILAVLDVVESGAANEAVFGRLGNDEFRLYRGSNGANVRLRANGINYDATLTTGTLPTGKFLLTLRRNINGVLTIDVDDTNANNIGTTITDLFDFTRLGNGATDCFMYELVFFNDRKSDTDLAPVIQDISNRNGL